MSLCLEFALVVLLGSQGDRRSLVGAREMRAALCTRPGPVRVMIELAPRERGPAQCPKALRPVLAALEDRDPARRSAARQRLACLDWRHLSWLVPESWRGGIERRMALGFVVRELRVRRYAEPTP